MLLKNLSVLHQHLVAWNSDAVELEISVINNRIAKLGPNIANSNA